MYAMTAAHKSLPLPTYVEVRNLANGKTVIVKVNDRGPFHENRIIDLSYTAAAKLDILARGTGLVEIRSIDPSADTVRQASAGETAVDVAGFPDQERTEFYIQVGAFSQRINAEKMRDRLISLGEPPVTVNEITVNGEPIYRVRIGPIRDVMLADRIVSGLGSYGIHEHHISVD